MWLYSKRSVLHLKPIFYYMSVGAVVPFFNFERMQLAQFRLKPFFYVFCGFWGVFIYFQAFSEIVTFDERRSYQLMELVLLVFSALCNSCALCITCFRQSLWEELLQRLAYLEDKPNLNTLQEKSGLTVKSLLFNFLLFHLLLGGVSTASFFLRGHDAYFFFIYRLMHAISVYSIFFLVNTLLSITRDKYTDIEQLLWQSVDRLDTQNIKKCRVLYRKLQIVMRILNQLCGAPVFWIFFYSGYKLIYVSTTEYNDYMLGMNGISKTKFIGKIAVLVWETVSIMLKSSFVQIFSILF